jgi:tetratricopeptide (TPR) repeat protein
MTLRVAGAPEFAEDVSRTSVWRERTRGTAMMKTAGFCAASVVSLLIALMPVTASAADGEYDLSAEVQAHLESLPDDNLRAEYLNEQVAKSPSDVSFLFHLGNIYYDMSKMADAVTNFEKAIELAPGFVGALVNLGGAYDELGRLDDALRVYRQALEIDPNEDRTLCNIGGVYFRKRQYRQAIDHFQRAIEANPESQLAHYNMAILFADSQIYQEAITEWQACVDIDAESDLGQRSQQNIGIIHQMMSAKTPELEGSGS